MTNQLFFLSLADIFSVYPKIFKDVIISREKPSTIFLPSDEDWQDKMYCRLLEVQKRVNEAAESGIALEEVTKRKEKPSFDDEEQLPYPFPSNGFIKKCNQSCCIVNANERSITWSLDNVGKAAKLLRKPPLPVSFENEHEMRKVYSLIYDVFRYKVVLANALTDISFCDRFPQYLNDQNRLWLMLYELLNRQFKRRNFEDIHIQEKLYLESDVAEIAEQLWKCRIPLAASISRMRIQYGALNLSQLLPIHLQNEKVSIAASNRIITGWINPFYLRKKHEADDFLFKMGLNLQEKNTVHSLRTTQYNWDITCPLFISCIPEDRSEFTKTALMPTNYFIMQDKTFAFGPAVMSKLLDAFQLDGDILQTHISSPRSTAYLAALYYSVNRLNNFYVYGAGSNLKEYRRYMENLGITNIRIFAEAFTSFPLESKRFATVVGIFANPPNSFSGIADPIDLICSRGGDLSMLEVLTESEISDEGKHRVSLILEEQLLTLQMAMSRPQIQFILYQTHSIINSENQDMVKYATNFIGQATFEKHKNALMEKKRLQALAEAEAANIPSAAMNTSSPRKRNANTAIVEGENVVSSKQGQESIEESVKVPESDEFIFEVITDESQDKAILSQFKGCFLALIRRKAITQLNAKYLIKMAEMRGLFGKADTNKLSKQKGQKPQEPVIAKPSANDGISRSKTSKSCDVDMILTRLRRDTNASSIRSNLAKVSLEQRPILFNYKRRQCMRIISSSRKLAVTTSNFPETLPTAEKSSNVSAFKTSEMFPIKKFVFSAHMVYEWNFVSNIAALKWPQWFSLGYVSSRGKIFDDFGAKITLNFSSNHFECAVGWRQPKIAGKYDLINSFGILN